MAGQDLFYRVCGPVPGGDRARPRRSAESLRVERSGALSQLDRRIVNYLLGNNQIDERLANIATVCRPGPGLEHVLVEPVAKTQLTHIIQRHFSAQTTDRRLVVVHLHGPYGVGKRDLALGACAQLNCPLLRLDMELLLAHESEAETLLRLAFREGLLLQAAVYLDNLDSLLSEDLKAKSS